MKLLTLLPFLIGVGYGVLVALLFQELRRRLGGGSEPSWWRPSAPPPRPSPIEGKLLSTWNPNFLHVKSGGLYQRLPITPIWENTREALVLYSGEDGQVWARFRKEFYDGRFVPYLEQDAKYRAGSNHPSL